MKQWKYTKQKKAMNFEEYLKLELGKKVTIVVKSPEILKKTVDGNYRTVFQGTVVEIDGMSETRMLIIKNYKNVMDLKKKISGKKEIKLELTRRYDEDDMETYYDIGYPKG